MKNKIFIGAVLLVMSFIQSCGEDINLPNEILAGEINGNEWQFEVGKADADPVNRAFLVELYNFTGFTENDGCLLFPGTSPHLSLTIPFGVQNGQQLDAISSNLVFHRDGANSLTADRGFIEISFINSREVRGFISSGSSSDNSAQGFFSVLICN